MCNAQMVFFRRYVANPTTRVTLNGQILTPLGYFVDVIKSYERYEKHCTPHIARDVKHATADRLGLS